MTVLGPAGMTLSQATELCGGAPLAFFVRHRGQGLLFYRTHGAPTGPPPEAYCVIALPSECDAETLRWRGFEPPEDSRLLGVVPMRDLGFEHGDGYFVDAASLSTALERLSP